MLKSHLRIAFRTIIRHKGFSLINILGLALGTACCLYILLYIQDEYSYDQHHNDVESIYRVTTDLGKSDPPKLMATCSPPIPEAMKQDFPEVEEATRFVGMFTSSQQIFRHNGKVYYESNGAFADATFFNIFTYKFIHGNAQQALAAPYNIVLSTQTANKIFGRENPMGKTLEMDTDEGRLKLTVTGVFSKELGKSHVQVNYFLSMNSGGIGAYAMQSQDWAGNNFTNAYVKLKPSASLTALESKLPAFLKRYGGMQLTHRDMQKQLLLQPITDIHTNTTYEAEPSKPVSTTLLSVLLTIAVFIQLIACINFMNLSTARAARRALEIGLRKVVGARPGALIGQFMSESLVFTFLAMLMAIPLVLLLLPRLNSMTGVELPLDFLKDGQVWLGILGLCCLTGVLAGSYPAFYLSGFRPLKALKEKVSHTGGNTRLRQGLVVFQFMLAISLIIGVIVINAQLSYLQKQDLGYDPNQKIVVPFRTGDALQKAGSYCSSIQQLPEVKSVSRANNFPSQMVFNDMTLYRQGQSMKEAIGIKFMRTDQYFVSTLGMELIQGRDFRLTDIHTDSTGTVIANEAMLRELQIPLNEAVGQSIFYDSPDNYVELMIIGVMKDFNFNALYSEVTPFMLLYSNSESNQHLIINADTDDYGQFISQLESIWQSQIPSVPFEYTFIDEEVQKQYEGDRRLSRIINSFTFLTIVISCLGLLGLAMFTAERRTKEIGIRKVLGASVISITTLICKEFLQPVIIALLLAIPVAWWVLQQWLADFAYHVTIQWWMFTLAGTLAIVIALLTVSFQSIKAALANPIEALRSE